MQRFWLSLIFIILLFVLFLNISYMMMNIIFIRWHISSFVSIFLCESDNIFNYFLCIFVCVTSIFFFHFDSHYQLQIVLFTIDLINFLYWIVHISFLSGCMSSVYLSINFGGIIKTEFTLDELNSVYNSMVSCQKGPTHHAYAWQIGPFW